MGTSLNPADAGGGMSLKDVPATITSALFVQYDYEGVAEERPCLQIEFESEAIDDPRPLYLSVCPASQAKDWKIVENGRAVQNVDEKPLWNRSDLFNFLSSFVEAGFPGERLGEEDVRCLEGVEIIFGESERSYYDKNERTRKTITSTIVAKVVNLPTAKASKAKAKAKAKTAPKSSSKSAPAGAEPASGNGTLQEPRAAFETFVLMKLMDEESIKSTDLFMPWHNSIKMRDDKKECVDILNDHEWLGHADRPWVLANGQYSRKP